MLPEKFGIVGVWPEDVVWTSSSICQLEERRLLICYFGTEIKINEKIMRSRGPKSLSNRSSKLVLALSHWRKEALVEID